MIRIRNYTPIDITTTIMFKAKYEFEENKPETLKRQTIHPLTFECLTYFELTVKVYLKEGIRNFVILDYEKFNNNLKDFFELIEYLQRKYPDINFYLH